MEKTRTKARPDLSSPEREVSSGASATPPENRSRPQGADAIKAISELITSRPAEDKNARPDDGEEVLKDGEDGTRPAPGNALDGTSSEDRGEIPEEAEERPAPRQKPRSMAEAAEALGMTADELYALDVGIGGDDGTVTLGELKDQFKERAELNRGVARKELELEDREGGIRRAEDRLAEVYELAKSAFSPGTQERIGDWLDERNLRLQAQEALHLARRMPEINDDKWRGRFEQYLIKAGQEFGFQPAELIGMRDHRVFMVLKRLMDREAMLERLLAVVPKPREPQVLPPQGRNGAGGDSDVQRARKTGKEADKVRAVNSILRGRH